MTARIEQASAPQLMARLEDGLSDHDRKVFNQWLVSTVHLWVGTVDGTLACTWGLVPPSLLSNSAFLWLYTTPRAAAHKFLFVRHSQVAIAGMLELYEEIVGLTRHDAEQSQRWIKWLGGAYGPRQGDFMPFTIRRRADG